MKKNLLYIIAVLSVLVACTEEKMEIGTPLTGQDVKFSVSMGNNSRTIYGAEETDEETGRKSIKVNWVNGDKITVFGTTCSVQQADYSVVANTADQNYADDLVKTGAAGVQWGSEPSDFYAIYPAVEDAIEVDGGVVYINTSVRQYQNNDFVFNESTNTWVGIPYVEGSTSSTMPDALMYAYTGGVKSTDNNGVVNLNFKPFSTVLKFTLDGWTVHNDMTDEVGPDPVAYVQKITVKAPEPVTGQCVFKMVGSSVSEVEGGEFEDIVIYPKSLPLMQGQKLEFSAFAIPTTYMMNSTDKPWIVEIETTNFGVHTYHIQPTVPQELVAGEIHKVKIPAIEVNRGEFTLPAKNWIRWIPRNVYLSELSVPGAWYATNGDYQNETDLSKQYEKGIRAFNIDCRVTSPAKKYSIFTGSGYSSSDSGNYLAVAGTEDASGIVSLYVTLNAGQTVLSALQTISNQLKDDSEFVYAILTIAEKPKDYSGMVLGTVEPTAVMNYIKSMLDANGKNLKVFGYRDKDKNEDGTYKTINANTTLNDVLGSMIIKINVNVDQEATDLSSFNINNALLCEGSMASDADYITNPIVPGTFTKMNEATLYWGTSMTDPSMTYYYHQAQLTTSSITESSNSSTPSLKDRMDAVDDIINKSASIYNENKHNGLFQLGIGGYIKNSSEDRATVANTLNPHVLTQVNNKLNTSPSPIGIVLMNYCTDNTYKSLDLVNAILNMNTKFYLNRIKDEPEWPDGNPYLEEGKDNGDF